MVKFLKYLNLWICKFLCILCSSLGSKQKLMYEQTFHLRFNLSKEPSKTHFWKKNLFVFLLLCPTCVLRQLLCLCVCTCRHLTRERFTRERRHLRSTWLCSRPRPRLVLHSVVAMEHLTCQWFHISHTPLRSSIIRCRRYAALACHLTVMMTFQVWFVVIGLFHFLWLLYVFIVAAK